MGRFASFVQGQGLLKTFMTPQKGYAYILEQIAKQGWVLI